jgi:crossover junction endodeoxyribonuclease RusA
MGYANRGGTISLVIPGRPVPAVRMTRKGAYVKKNAQRYLNYKKAVAWTALSKRIKKIDGPVEVKVDIYLCGGNQGDIDNYAKSLTDALNKLAYDDDKQVTRLIAEKHQCEKKDERAEIAIRGMGDEKTG